MNENKQYVSKINGYYIKDGEARESISSKADSSTTLAGYGITDAYTKTEVDTSLQGKADTSTTLAGYGITDAYTKSEVDNALMNLPNTYVLTGTVTLPANDTEDPSKKFNFSLDYPDGFTRDNTYILAFQGSIEQSDNMGAFGYGSSTVTSLLYGILERTIYLTTNKINASVWNPATNDKGYNYKILLMRIDAEVEPEENNGGE